MNTSPLSIGIDLGGTKIAAGLCRNGEIVARCLRPTAAEKGAPAVLAAMIDACREVAAAAAGESIIGVGVGAAGQVDPATGAVIYAPNLGWKDVPLAATLSRELSLPVRVTNDVRAATIAEWYFGAAKGMKSFVNIFLGTGIGSGLVLNGALLTGTTNSAGEIGHICLDPEGPICGCGQAGCFEAFSSGRGLENQVKARLEKGETSIIREMVNGDWAQVTGRVIGDAARKGDALALSALDVVGRNLGLVMANLHTLLNPESLLLGGGLMALEEFFLPQAEATLTRIVLPVARRKELFRRAQFQTDAALIGSSALFT
jgi:glucokinase